MNGADGAISTEAEFIAAVRDALRHYHRPDRPHGNGLLRSRLVAAALAAEPAPAPTQALKDVLRAQCESLSDTPKFACLKRVLELTYLAPMQGQQQVADALHLSWSTYRRRLADAVQLLAAQLWEAEEALVARQAREQSSAVAERPALPRTGWSRTFIGFVAVAVVGAIVWFLLPWDSPQTAANQTVTGRPAIAVLPFNSRNGNGVASEQYFADGLSADLITALSQFDGLKVISRNSSFQFRDPADSSLVIGRKLGVTSLLEGSVLRIGDQVRITAELVNAADGRILWSRHYDRPYEGLFRLQDEITKAVANVLKVRLLTRGGVIIHTDRPPSGNLAAYRAWLHGRAAFAHDTEADVRRAITFYRKAIRIDPNYALAYATLSRAWTALGGTFLGGAEQRQAFNKARAASDQALRLDPGMAAAYVARGFTALYKFDWHAAQVDFQHALRLAPRDGEAQFMLAQLSATLGQLDRAVALMRQALITDPRNGLYYYMLSEYLAALGRLDNAEQAIRTAIALHPKGSDFHERLAVIKILRGDAAGALHAAEQEPPGPWRDIAIALARQIGDDRAAADAALKNLSAKYADSGAYQIAEVYAVRKEPDAMFRWLNRAWASRDPGVGDTLHDALILRYRHDPRFAAFAATVGLSVPSAGRATARTHGK